MSGFLRLLAHIGIMSALIIGIALGGFALGYQVGKHSESRQVETEEPKAEKVADMDYFEVWRYPVQDGYLYVNDRGGMEFVKK
jgi:hypothetical protein